MTMYPMTDKAFATHYLWWPADSCSGTGTPPSRALAIPGFQPVLTILDVDEPGSAPHDVGLAQSFANGPNAIGIRRKVSGVAGAKLIFQLSRVGRLRGKGLPGTAQILKRRGHARRRSAKF